MLYVMFLCKFVSFSTSFVVCCVRNILGDWCSFMRKWALRWTWSHCFVIILLWGLLLLLRMMVRRNKFFTVRLLILFHIPIALLSFNMTLVVVKGSWVRHDRFWIFRDMKPIYPLKFGNSNLIQIGLCRHWHRSDLLLIEVFVPIFLRCSCLTH